MQPLLYETHMHTPLCRHATGEPEEYAAVAITRGLRGIIVTCHNPMPDGYAQSSRMYPGQFEEYLGLVQRARERMAGRTDVRLGLECDYLPGAESWLERQLASAEFHYVLGSIHPHVGEYRALYWAGDAVAYQRLYFEHLAQAAETGLFDCLSHPDLVKNVDPEAWRPAELMEYIGACLDRIAATGVAMELNTSGAHKVVREMNPGVPILREMQERGIPVVVGADAHVPERVGESFDAALAMLADVGYQNVSLFLDRRRQEISIKEAQESLQGESGSCGAKA
jgi:histidinol-phosphatase (PHP family)